MADLQHVVVVLKLAFGYFFNRARHDNAYGREDLRGEMLPSAASRRRWSGEVGATFCRIFRFFTRSSGNFAAILTFELRQHRKAKTETSREDTLSRFGFLLVPFTFLNDTLPGCSASSSLIQTTPSQQCSTCTHNERR